jgi:hypothetical protein
MPRAVSCSNRSTHRSGGPTIAKRCMYVAYCVGFGRMAATYRIIEELPESFQDTTRKIIPWAEGHSKKLVIRA